jgi:hypothetical protein
LMRCIEPSTQINHFRTSSALKVHAKIYEDSVE